LAPEGAACKTTLQGNASKLIVGGGFVGAIFAIGSAAIFLVGVPILRVIFPAAIVLGVGIALVFHFMRHKTPGSPWLLTATEGETETSHQREHRESPGHSQKVYMPVQSPADLSPAIS
jgi:hypothetical protein